MPQVNEFSWLMESFYILIIVLILIMTSQVNLSKSLMDNKIMNLNFYSPFLLH